MQQRYQCPGCGAQVAFGAGFCGNCGTQLNWPTQQQPQPPPSYQQQQIEQSIGNEQEVPSMHIIPLDPRTKLPVVFEGENERTLPAITTDGRISFFPAETDLEQAILAKIEERYPKARYHDLRRYVCAGIMLKSLRNDWAAFIFDVCGFWEPMPELEYLYHILYSLGGKTVGGEYWSETEKHLSSEPVKTGINTIIDFLKKELRWQDYVERTMEELEQSSY